MSAGQRLLEQLRGEQDAMTELLEDLVLMESPSTEPASQAPIRARLKAEFEEIGYRVHLRPGRDSGGHVFAGPRRRGHRQPAQLMLGHCDTVWPAGTSKLTPFRIGRFAS